MAKIHEEVLVIKVSQLLKDNDDSVEIVDADLAENLETVIKELTGGDKLVEVYKEN